MWDLTGEELRRLREQGCVQKQALGTKRSRANERALWCVCVCLFLRVPFWVGLKGNHMKHHAFLRGPPNFDACQCKVRSTFRGVYGKLGGRFHFQPFPEDTLICPYPWRVAKFDCGTCWFVSLSSIRNPQIPSPPSPVMYGSGGRGIPRSIKVPTIHPSRIQVPTRWDHSCLLPSLRRAGKRGANGQDVGVHQLDCQDFKWSHVVFLCWFTVGFGLMKCVLRLVGRFDRLV